MQAFSAAPQLAIRTVDVHNFSGGMQGESMAEDARREMLRAGECTSWTCSAALPLSKHTVNVWRRIFKLGEVSLRARRS